MTDAAILAALEATWPPARRLVVGPWIIREGLGGGQRLSAATLDGEYQRGSIPLAEAAMRKLGQAPLFLLNHDDAALDDELTASGYHRHDPVVIYAIPCANLTEPAPDAQTGVAQFVSAHWPPLAMALDLWRDAGIGPGRIAAMHRVTGSKAALLGRLEDRPAAVGFVAQHGPLAVLHALDVSPACRRQGMGQAMLRHAASWVETHGARQIILAVTAANVPARAMYERLGLCAVGSYHYRIRA